MQHRGSWRTVSNLSPPSLLWRGRKACLRKLYPGGQRVVRREELPVAFGLNGLSYGFHDEIANTCVF